MKKYLLIAMMVVIAMCSFGCGGRNAEFGVVDMKVVDEKAEILKTVKEEIEAKGKALQEEMQAKLKGKNKQEQAKIIEDYQTQMQVINSEAQNKLKASFDTALNEVAKEKGLGAILIKDAVGQGGTDVTDAVVAKMK